MRTMKPTDHELYDEIKPNNRIYAPVIYYSMLREIKRLEAKLRQFAARHKALEEEKGAE